MSAIPVWLDCDPGHDDAFAILLCNHPSINLIGISTVAGNQTLDKTTRNARTVLDVSEMKNIPVLRGSSQPLVGHPWICAEVHGDTGLNRKSGKPLPTIHDTEECTDNYLLYILKQFKDYYDQHNGRKVVLVGTGPLTNIGILFAAFPLVKSYIEKVVFMGGAVGMGNTSPAAEFNIQMDPEAASIVIHSGLPVYMVPLEVTHTALVTEQVLAGIKAALGHTPFHELVVDWMLFFSSSYEQVFNMKDPPLHDPCAIAAVIDPSLFQIESVKTTVVTGEGSARGRTMCYMFPAFQGDVKDAPTVHVAVRMDVDGFWRLMLQALSIANGNAIRYNSNDGNDTSSTSSPSSSSNSNSNMTKKKKKRAATKAAPSSSSKRAK